MLINRDPFARVELHRRREEVIGASCAWCGNVHRTKAGRFYLYRYSREHDGGRKADCLHLFCSVGCLRDYYDEA